MNGNSLAHEIRNPMKAIRSGIQMLRGEMALSRDGRDVIDDVIHEVDRRVSEVHRGYRGGSSY